MHPQALALRAGVQALGLSLDDRRIDQLLAYLDLLARWNNHATPPAFPTPRAW